MQVDFEQKSNKEADRNSKFDNGRKSLRVIIITLIIAGIITAIAYGVVKIFSNYTVTYVTFGGTVYGEEKEPDVYRYKDNTIEPKLKKEGYYVAGYSTDPNFRTSYTFGSMIKSNLTIYVDWQPGVACQLRFADGEENEDLPLDELKIKFEEYVKSGSEYTLPLITNTNEDSEHFGEQLLWYESPECEGVPIMQKTYLLSDNVMLYGKWFDSVDDNYEVDDNGVLKRYLGYSKNLILPSNIREIKDIDSNRFTYNIPTGANENLDNYSCFYQVIDTVKTIYINRECVKVGANAFRSCSVLESVYFLGDDVSIIGENAFNGCIKLTKIRIPNKVTVIKKGTFFGDYNLTTMQGGENIATIEEIAFANSGIESIELANVSRIDKGAFAGCDNLCSVTFGGSSIVSTNATTGENNIFYDTNSDLKIYVNSGFVNYYKSTSPWSEYESRFYSINV